MGYHDNHMGEAGPFFKQNDISIIIVRCDPALVHVCLCHILVLMLVKIFVFILFLQSQAVLCPLANPKSPLYRVHTSDQSEQSPGVVVSSSL